MTPYTHTAKSQSAPPPVPPARSCPRCRAVLAVIHRHTGRVETMTAFMCPSVTCGYKLIVPR